jgi:hypothetical protein
MAPIWELAKGFHLGCLLSYCYYICEMQATKAECPVCQNTSSEKSDEIMVLNKFPAEHLLCSKCGQEWFQNASLWLSEAYSSPIANTDTGIVARSLNYHKIIASYLALTKRSSPILDWGSGSGLLVRLLRDCGHSTFGFEPYTVPVLADSYTYKAKESLVEVAPFRAIVAIEVLEHLMDPRGFMTSVFAMTDTLIFTTELLNGNKDGQNWWYYSPETGQHVNFYTRTSLKRLAADFGCMYFSSGNSGPHIFSRRPWNMAAFKFVAGRKRSLFFYPVSRLVERLRGVKSLTMSDHLLAKGSLKQLK